MVELTVTWIIARTFACKKLSEKVSTQAEAAWRSQAPQKSRFPRVRKNKKMDFRAHPPGERAKVMLVAMSPSWGLRGPSGLRNTLSWWVWWRIPKDLVTAMEQKSTYLTSRLVWLTIVQHLLQKNSAYILLRKEYEYQTCTS